MLEGVLLLFLHAAAKAQWVCYAVKSPVMKEAVMRTLFLTMLMVILAGLAGCQQQQEKAKSPDTAQQAVEEPAPAVASKTAGVSAAVEHEVKKQAESAETVAKTTAQSVASSQQPATTPAKEVMADAGDDIAATTAVAETAGDPAKGAKIAKGKCGACHYFDKDRKKIGPTMMGIYNRAPAIEGVPFAKWDEAALDAWLANPRGVKPKTKMAFKGIAEKDKRDDLIAYLKTL